MVTQEQFLEQFCQQVQNGLKLWDSPSIAIGIIKDGQTVLCEGFGSRDLEKNLPATAATLYQTASCTKAFTAALVAILVDQGKLSWDEPLIRYLPNIRFFDDHTTKDLTLRDILSHRSGLPRHEYSWYGSDFTKDELIFNLRYLEPNQPIRTRFQYNNYGYMLAGYVVEQLTGKSWETCVDEYILKPLGMNRTNMFVEATEADPDHATAYDRTDPAVDMMKGMRPIPFYKMPDEDYSKGIGSPAGPAATVISCAEDMLKWVRLHLGKGEFEGKRIISEEAMNQMHKPTMLLPDLMDMPHTETTVPAYGMGWFVECYRGHTLIQHGGNIDGFSAWTSFIPDLNLGVVAYTNMNVSSLPTALAREVYDYYLGVESGNWVQRYHKHHTESSAKRGNLTVQLAGEQTANTVPSHDLAAYIGIYRRDGYSDATVYLKDGALYLKFIDADTQLRHYHYDTFLTSNLLGGGEVPPGLPVSFHTADFRSEIESLVMPLCFELGAAPIRFRKQKPKEA